MQRGFIQWPKVKNCPLPSFTSQIELTPSPVSYILKQSSTVHPHGPLIWLGFHGTHTNRPGPPALTITNGESSSPIPQSHAHATLPSPWPPTPSGPSQPIDELPLHQNYQQRGSDLYPNSYPSTDIGCLEPNDQNSQLTTSAILIHSPPSQEEFQWTCMSSTSFTPDCLVSALRELSPLFYWYMCKKNHYFIDLSATSAFPVSLVTEWCFKDLNVPR